MFSCVRRPVRSVFVCVSVCVSVCVGGCSKTFFQAQTGTRGTTVEGMTTNMLKMALLSALVALLWASTHVSAQDQTLRYIGESFNNGSCSHKKLTCAEHALCEQNPEHTRFRCYCQEPFVGDGYLTAYRPAATGCKLKGNPETCKSSADCHPLASCVPMKGTQVSICVCKAGYSGVGSITHGCKDIEECKGNPCAVNAKCTEKPGSYSCACDSTKNYEGDGYKTCYWVCYKHGECSPNARCVNKKCKCSAGYLEDGRNCTDINECDTGKAKCPDKSVCKNLPGSYKCVCKSGFEDRNGVCVPYYKTCDEKLKATPGMTSGRYTLDFDGEGPLPALTVQCVVKGSFAVTEVEPSPSFPKRVPSQGGTTPVSYPVDVKPLVDNSNFCSQEVWIKCTRDYDGGPVQWEDAKGRSYTGFGGTTSGKCACGELGLCPGGCNCGKGRMGEDTGLILLKGALPLTKVVLPRSKPGGSPGIYFVGKLRCAPNTFDMPKNCHEAKFKYRIFKNTPLYIDIDGQGPAPPMLVYCNQESYSHVGITEIPPNKLQVKTTTSQGEVVGYSLPGPTMSELIKGSVFCSQRVEYQCQRDTRTAAGVRVTTRGGVMTYFPGGSNKKPGSCPCGLTNSCDSPKVQCNCDIGDGKARKDLGLIIDKSQLPVLNVRTTSSSNSFSIGPLQCSEMQFGFYPNCDKMQQDDIKENYSFPIDPDGPGGKLDPFTVECEMEKNQGVTVINNQGGDNMDLQEGKIFTIEYLETTPAQLSGLKVRSTVCLQTVRFTKCPAGGSVNIASFTYNGGRALSEQLTELCPKAVCPCDKDLIISEKEQLPVAKITGSKSRLSIGALKCKEIYPDCELYNRFVKTKGVLGEKVLQRDTLTIDPDGPKEGQSFVVRCQHKVTIIDKPKTSEKPVIKVIPGGKNPGVVCWKLNYTDANGVGIGDPQMDALMKTAKSCAQTFKLTCSNAMGTGKVYYKNCADKKFTSFVSGETSATCACGATGTCDGGSDKGCNCDSSGSQQTNDLNWIISNKRLPICEVCMELDDITGSGAGTPDSRSIKFEVSDLKCGKKQGRRGNCQLYRQELGVNSQSKDRLREIWMDTSNKPVLVGCRFIPQPPVGEMIIRPQKPVFIPGENIVEGKVTIIYRGFPIIAFRDVTRQANYCTQDLLFFCASEIPDLTGGSYGLYSGDTRLQTSDYELRQLSAQKISEICKDERFSGVCKKCGQSVKRLVVTNKSVLPLTKVLLPKTSKVHLGVDSATCAYVERDCEAIRRAGKIRSYKLMDGFFVIDPDQAGPLPPFKVLCDFSRGNTGVTTVLADPKWVAGEAGGIGGYKGAEFTFQHTYPGATPEQVRSLVENSQFCWQGVKYHCKKAPLTDATLLGFNNQSAKSFGTAGNPDATGCACSVLGTCKQKGLACNCDSKGVMTDQGAVTDRGFLPVTGFKVKFAPKAEGKLAVTDLRCSPLPVDPPRDCAEAFAWRHHYGIDYRKGGEHLISPNPGKVAPFLVYCDYSIDPFNPVTVIKPKPTKDVPVGANNTDVPYQGPSDKQIFALVEASAYCYQPVKVDCYSASFIKAGVRFLTVDGSKRAFWSSGTGDSATCTCGSKDLCGGTVSKSKQELTNCNCDIGDKEYRSDAAILNVKKGGPLRGLLTKGIFSSASGQMNLTVGDVFCAQKPIEFNECATGFHDCSRMAKCTDDDKGYKCECPPGWNGRVVGSALVDLPMANGRQCIDDNECTMSLCPYSSVCQNTPGAYWCKCKAGYRQTSNFTCEDIDECLSADANKCDPNARCINTDGSYVCRCRGGFRGNGMVGQCYPVAQCMCFGDPHCESFDGKWNHFQGRCSYVMASTDCALTAAGGGQSNKTLPRFLVATQNWDQGYVGSGEYAWVKEVTVKVYGTTIVLGQGVNIRVDGVQKQSYRKMSSDNTKLLVSVTVKKSDVMVYTDFGLEVVWDGDNEVTVYAPASFSGRTCGLCGNFNKKPEDDWQIGPACPKRAGQTTTREPLFGNSWALNTDKCTVDCDPPEPVSTCDMSVIVVRRECAKLFSDPAFSTCLDKMPWKDFVGFNVSCEYDMCHSDNIRRVLCAMGTTISRYCAELLTDVIAWKKDEMCKEKSCSDTLCLKPNAYCLRGECVCKMGFTEDCHQCVDINECDIGEHNCTYLGQRCINLPGSYECGCLPGFKKSGKYCKNINECEDPKIKCPDHAQCEDFPGGYRCSCCMGYVMKDKECKRDKSLDVVYGAPGKECCACTGTPCDDPKPVCGTDGKSYPNYRAMVVKSCTTKRHIEVDYPGPCQNSCESKPCKKPFQTCSVQSGVATCKCPTCGGGGSPQKSDAVCASNKRVYPSQCQFQLTMCETNRSDISKESSMEPCDKDKKEPVGPWSKWSECSNKCGKGTTKRRRQKRGPTTYPLAQEGACYTVCDDGPCQKDTCTNPGQVCQQNKNTGKAECVCPDCDGQPDSPVCGLVGVVVRNYDNACELQKKACEQIQNYTVLKERSCEDKPRKCAREMSFVKENNKNGCVPMKQVDVGACAGACGHAPGLCCLPVKKSPPRTVTVVYRCSNGLFEKEKREVITDCDCQNPPKR